MDIRDQILKLIEASDVITVFRHANPDGDAYGAQFAFVQWIKETYPTKKVYAVGQESSADPYFPPCDEVSDEVIKESLAIVLDLANLPRVDDKRVRFARKIIKIDHHPNDEPFGDVQYVVVESAATCQILTRLFERWGNISKQTATYLYRGILTDTLGFSTSNTTVDTLLCGAKLAEKGLPIADLNREMFDVSYEEFMFTSHVRYRTQLYKEMVAYVILDEADLRRYGMTPNRARSFVAELGHVKNFKVWCMLTQNGNVYDGSLRAKNTVINTIAQKYHGGGHQFASGIKDVKPEEITTLLEDLYQAIEK
ncbi:MAG: bifunctional oligoribonuclease/PAP phosphatase NrnA [Erysipelotrichaceae bacterium]|nr:bifunctional oligoribonuclease/PAP phosphatase NrnA [Erysipelotrichaceae bacterium]